MYTGTLKGTFALPPPPTFPQNSLHCPLTFTLLDHYIHGMTKLPLSPPSPPSLPSRLPFSVRAELIGIRVVVTSSIGGVQQGGQESMDVSSDLLGTTCPSLSR